MAIDCDESINPACAYMLGEIKGRLDSIDTRLVTQGTTLTSIDGRLRTVESRAARNGALMGLSVAIVAETVKAKLGLG